MLKCHNHRKIELSHLIFTVRVAMMTAIFFLMFNGKSLHPMFSKKVFLSKEVNNVHFNESCNQHWFDEECRSERKCFFTALNTYRCDKTF